MSFFKIVVLVLGLAAVAFAARYALDRTAGEARPGASEPRRQLDNVREKAHEFEGAQQQHAEGVDQRTGG